MSMPYSALSDPSESSPRRAERLTPDQVDSWDFPRVGMAKRGLDEDAVLRFKRRVLNDLRTTSQIEADLRSRVNDLTAQLRASYGGVMPSPGATAAAAEPRITVAAVNAISSAQRQAEEQIRAAEEYVRNVTEYARNQYQATVNEGHRQGLIAAEAAFQRRSESLSSNLAHLESQLDFLKAFGMAFGVQVEASLEKARDEVHSMIGTIKAAFDTLKNPQAHAQPGVGAGGRPVPPSIGG